MIAELNRAEAPVHSARPARRAPLLAYPHTWMREGAGESPWIALIRRHLNPGLAVGVLLALAPVFHQKLTASVGTLAALAFVLSLQLVSRPRFEHAHSQVTWWDDLRQAACEWCYVVLMLLAVGYLLKAANAYSHKLLIAWFILTPLAFAGAQSLARRITRWRLRQGALRRRLVVVGATKVGCELASRLNAEPWLGTVDGFFDDRRTHRLPRAVRARLLGRFGDIA